MIIFLLMNLIVGTSAFLLNYRILKFNNFVNSHLSLFILYISQIVFTELLLGILGILYIENVILLNLAILLIIWFITRNKESYFSLIGINKTLTELLNNKIILLCTCVILGFGLVKIFINLINPPFGWDSLNYHFTFPVEWLKSGRLDNPIVVGDDPFPAYYPINGSLLFLWLIFPFKNAFLADIGQLPFFIASFLAILSIGKKLGLDRKYSFFAAALFVFIPNFFKQLQIGYIDIIMAALFLTALNFLLALFKDFNFKNIFFFSLALGLFLGLKTTAIAYGVFLVLAFIAILFFEKKAGVVRKLKYLFSFALIIYLFSFFSYYKNFMLTSNPFYPLDIQLFGKTIFKGVIDKATFTSRNNPKDYALAKLLFHEGLGLQSILIILPTVIFAPIVNFFKEKKESLLENYIMCLPLLLYLVYRFILPIPNSRYLYPMLGVGMITGFFMLRTLRVPEKILKAIIIICLIASAVECARHAELFISLGLSFLIFIFFSLPFKYKKINIIFTPKIVTILGLLIFFSLMSVLSLDYKKNEYRRYVKNSPYWPDATKAWLWLNENTRKNNIAYVGRPVPYPLYGTNFKNNVYYVSVNAQDPIKLHYLKDSIYRWDSDAINMHKSFEEPNNYRGNADFSVWLENLKKRKTDFLFIYSLHHTKDIRFPIEESWAKDYPEKFSLVFKNETIRIYRLNI